MKLLQLFLLPETLFVKTVFTSQVHLGFSTLSCFNAIDVRVQPSQTWCNPSEPLPDVLSAKSVHYWILLNDKIALKDTIYEAILPLDIA